MNLIAALLMHLSLTANQNPAALASDNYFHHFNILILYYSYQKVERA
jgi:sulfur relay (sulfurtransferase) DsrF/TusC family protein